MFQLYRRCVRRSVAHMLVAGCIWASAAAATAAGAPTTQATRPPLGRIDIDDYATILLAPKLQDTLNFTDSQRETASGYKMHMKATLDNATGDLGPDATPGAIASRGQSALAMFGKGVRTLLTPEQDTQFVSMFENGTLQDIHVAGNVSRIYGTTTGKIEIGYTHFGEKQPAGVATTEKSPGPVALTPAPATPSAGGAEDPAAAPARRPRPVRRGRPGVASAVADLGQAVQFLSGSDVEQAGAATFLATCAVDTTQRVTVLKLLKPHINDPDGNVRLPFVQAFAHWATAAEKDDLVGVVAYPATTQGISHHENSWAAAVMGLMHIDPDAAEKAVESRSGVFFFKTELSKALLPVALSEDADGPAARRLYKRINSVGQ